MAQAVSKQGLSIAASNVLLAGVYSLFAFAHFTSYQQTGRLSLLLIIAFESICLAFILTRRDPSATWHSPWTWFTMLGGTFGPLLFRPTNVIDDMTAGQIVQVLGICLQIAALSSLNRSFGLLPAHRGIKSNGLYRWVRHPLYAAYLLANLGYIASNFSLYNLAILLAATGFQVLRIHNEETFLRRYDEYADYMQRTKWRVIPLVW